MNNEIENFKNLKTIWKNSFDKILEIKITNKRNLAKSKKEIFLEEKKKIDTKYDKQYKEEIIKNKIALSEKKNEANLEKINKRHTHVDSVIELTKENLKSFSDSKNKEYIALTQKLIVQSMTQMLEPECVVRCRKQDESMVSGLLNACEAEFSKIMKEATERDFKCSLSVDKTKSLDCVRYFF
jgi:vacuolar-type H+-ATPase subunit E/Vma4